MKRELAFALETQSQLITGSIGRTRNSRVQIHSAGFNDGSETRKRLRPESNFELRGSREDPESNNGLVDQNRSLCNGVVTYKRNGKFKKSNLETNLVILSREEEKIEKNEVSNEVTPRRFTRSVLNSTPKVELEECSEEGGESKTVLNVGVNGDSAVSNGLGNLTKKLEMKLSKKIALERKPTTIKELFGTGLLEGCSVFYNGGNKGSALRGVIKDVGILCFCSSCKGSNVVNPCQFEIHACKSYRRAAQYICLENGKSLLQVVKACENSPLGSLEETIQRFIGPLPEKESFICENCKGSFLGKFSEVKQLCESCISSRNTGAASVDNVDTNARPLKPVLAPKSSASASVRSSSRNKSQVRVTQNSSRAAAVLKSSASVLACTSSKNKSQGKITKKFSKYVSARKSYGSASVRIKSGRKIAKMSSKASLMSRSSQSSSQSLSPQKKIKWKITRKDLRLHKLVFEEGGLPEGAEVAYFSHGQKLLDGFKRGLGIFCRCCKSEVSPSQFEAHAGWAPRRKPYNYIYISNGVSLHEYALKILKRRKGRARDNDDLCTICADGGNLLLCDLCPRSFHLECIVISNVPRGKWYCNYCQNMFQREKFVEHNANAVAAGRVLGVELDPIDQITKRCIRIVKNPEEAEVIACVLCRGYKFSKTGFGPYTVIVCDQCEKEYHVGCLKNQKMADLNELPEGKWFCCMDCRRIHSALQNLLVRGEEKLPVSLLDDIKKKHLEKVPDGITDLDVKWRVLTGKIVSPETKLLLSKAVAIFHDCFDPIVEAATGHDFIPSMVFGRKIKGQDFGGMYCALLTVNSSVVSVGIFRVFGQEIAELPLVATSNGNQGKGYFRILFSCIEKLLAFLNVKTLVLPAADEAESIWTGKFGFEKIPSEQLSNYRKTCWQMLTFKGTSMLHKMVPHYRLVQKDAVSMESS